MKMKYSRESLATSNEIEDSNGIAKVSPFQGIISQCFEDHLDIYIAELDR